MYVGCQCILIVHTATQAVVWWNPIPRPVRGSAGGHTPAAITPAERRCSGSGAEWSADGGARGVDARLNPGGVWQERAPAGSALGFGVEAAPLDGSTRDAAGETAGRDAMVAKRPSRRVPTWHLLASPIRVGASTRDLTSSSRPGRGTPRRTSQYTICRHRHHLVPGAGRALGQPSDQRGTRRPRSQDICFHRLVS